MIRILLIRYSMNFLGSLKSCGVLLLILVSLAGYGAPLARYTFSEYAKYYGIKILLGLVIFFIGCGYLELFHLSSPLIFHAIIIVGIALFIFDYFRNIQRLRVIAIFSRRLTESDFQQLLVSVIAVIFVTIYCLNMVFYPFNHGDDYSSYLLFPSRILTEGFSGGDPFNVRGIEHGLGGGDYINALFLSLTPLPHIHLAESGIGFIALILIGVAHVRLMSKPTFLTVSCAFGSGAITAIFAQYTNITPILLGCAFGYGILFLGQMLQQNYQPRQSILLGALSACLILLKGNLIAPALVFLSTIFFARLCMFRKLWIGKEIVLTSLTIAVICLPWMLASYKNHGTLFYPLLGHGYSHSRGFGLVTRSEFIKASFEFFPLYGLLLSSSLAFWARSDDPDKKRFALILSIAIISSTLILAMTPAGMYRYCYVILATPCAFMINNNLSILKNQVINGLPHLRIRLTKCLIIAITAICSILMIHQVKRVGNHFFHDALSVRYLHAQSTQFPDTDFLAPQFQDTNQRYKKIQSIVPRMEGILAQVEAPFLFDFSRNTIFIADYPGNAGPGSGPPLDGSPEVLAQYLRSNHVRYLIHSYKSWLSKKDSEYFVKYCLNAEGQWGRTLAVRELIINDQLIELAKIYRTSYDDGRDRVINLCQNQTNSQNLCQKND